MDVVAKVIILFFRFFDDGAWQVVTIPDKGECTRGVILSVRGMYSAQCEK